VKACRSSRRTATRRIRARAVRKTSASIRRAPSSTPHSYGTEAFVATWQRVLPVVAARVKPDFIVVSAGYDFAAGDPVGDLGVDAVTASRALAALVRETADTYADGRVAYCLEGGYDVSTLALAVEATLRGHDCARAGERAETASIPAPQRALADAVSAWPT
jgi:acetoin utilization deacetylase AcuC-like enzyme